MRQSLQNGSLAPARFVQAISCENVQWLDVSVWSDQVAVDILGYNDAHCHSLNRLEYPSTTLPDYFPYEKSRACYFQALTRVIPIGTSDVFFDIGCGGGFPSLLMHAATGCRSIGIDIQQPLIDFARTCARELNVQHAVEFRNEEAATCDLSQGNIFLLSNPFQGELMRNVVNRLHALSQENYIVILVTTWCSGHEQLRDLFAEVRPGGPPSIFYSRNVDRPQLPRFNTGDC